MTMMPHGANATTLAVARFQAWTSVLGPGERCAVWLQGCPLRCAGCVVPEFLPMEGGTPTPVAELAQRICEIEGISGVSLTGGEPALQAEPLVALLDRVARRRPELDVLLYSGQRYDALLSRASRAQLELLARVDLVVDGPYVEGRNTGAAWSGSDNQRVLGLTERGRALLAASRFARRGVEFPVEPDGSFAFSGPQAPGFRDRFERELAARGVHVRIEEEAS